jgi:hypothetical protein
MGRILFTIVSCVALYLPAAAFADDLVPLTDTLVAEKVPDGFQAKTEVVENKDAPFKTTITKVGRSHNPNAVSITTGLRGESWSVKDRKDFVRGTIDPLTSAKGFPGGFQVVDKVIPDLDHETFDKPGSFLVVLGNDQGTKLFLYNEIFFTKNSYSIMIVGFKGYDFNRLKKWAKTIKEKEPAGATATP